jgi:hypothetical protein
MIKALTILVLAVPMAISATGVELSVQFMSAVEQAVTVTVSSGN